MKDAKTTATEAFYDNLKLGNANSIFFNMDNRFNLIKILKKKNIKIFFDAILKNYISKNDKVLDYGCGPGIFSIKLSKFCKKVVGVDISKEFVSLAKKNYKLILKKNYLVKKNNFYKIPFNNNSFDKILMVDVIHHLGEKKKCLLEINRVLKKNGRLLIYEPNVINPLIFLMHLLDKNEQGLLKLNKILYKKLFYSTGFKLLKFEYNGIVIGPESKIFEYISLFLNLKFIKIFLGWLNPKIFMVLKKTT
jgi:SAM-dependent methyltransferase